MLYAGDGARVRQTIKIGTEETGTVTYVGDLQVCEGKEAAPVSCAVNYIFAGDRLLAAKRPDTGTITYFHPDHLGSTNVVTDASGNKIEGLAYYPFGATRADGGTYDSPYKYTGQELDRYTGLYYYRARYYDPVLGRFIQPDPTSPNTYDPQSLNPYSYVLNNPLRYTDPTGLQTSADTGCPCIPSPFFGLPLIDRDFRARFDLSGAQIGMPPSGLTTPLPHPALTIGTVLSSLNLSNPLVTTPSTGIAQPNVAKPSIVIGAPSAGVLLEAVTILGLLLTSGDTPQPTIPSISLAEEGGPKEVKPEAGKIKNEPLAKPEFKEPKPGAKGKKGATDTPSWAEGKRPFKGESGKKFAERLLDERYGPGNYEKGPRSEFNRLQKYGDRHFR